jgi:uncharacterized protein YecE (DUF72 family)
MPEETFLDERRAKREARRTKQRALNGLRAEKMHRARMEAGNPEPTVYAMPRLNVGCSGWFYWHWRGLLYPQDMPTNQWFAHYARQFKTVELNAPFYSWPTSATIQAWIKQAGRRKFIYTVKACELITHIKKFEGTQRLVKDFGYIADVLGPRMGCFLYQLPPSFDYTPARLNRILSQLTPERRNVVEFRHKSWWNDKVYAAFDKTGTIFCSCSGPRLPDELIKTADDIYVRFHGTKRWYRHDYSVEELDGWAKRIREAGAAHVWAYFNNDRDGYAIKNAKALRRRLEKDVHLISPRRSELGPSTGH